MSAQGPPNPANGASDHHVAEVRYSLVEMRKEVEIERRNSNLGREKVDQTEIQKIFKKKRKRVHQ